MILRVPGGNREVRSFADASNIPTNGSLGGPTFSGQRVTASSAIALPAALASIRRLAETAASLPILVSEESPEASIPKPGAWQHDLLSRRPSVNQTPFDFVSYGVASMNGWGGAFYLKSKARGRVTELVPMQPAMVTPVVENGELVFKVRTGGKVTTLTRSSVLYIPFILFDHPWIGMSPIHVHREAIGAAQKLDEFGARFFSNDATPGLVIAAREGSTKQQRDEAKESWNAGMRGAKNAHKAAVLPDGFTVDKIGISPRDSQFIEGRKYADEEIARIFSLHPSDIGAGSETSSDLTMEDRNRRLLQFSIEPILTRIEQALAKDDDLFPDKSLVPMFDASALLRADTKTRYQANLQAKQGGWKTANEIRREEGLPPHKDGDELQVTPVGGAPNTKSADAPADQAPAEGA